MAVDDRIIEPPPRFDRGTHHRQCAKFEEYRTKNRPVMAKYSGRYPTKGKAHKMPEGGHCEAETGRHHWASELEPIDAWYTSTSDQDYDWASEHGINRHLVYEHQRPRLCDVRSRRCVTPPACSEIMGPGKLI